MTTFNCTIEACTNSEWLASAICDDHNLDHGAWMDDVSREYHGAACRFLRDRGIEHENPGGQRTAFHPWNGAHFSKRFGIFGVFGELTAEEEATLEEANQAGYEAACKFAAEQEASQNAAE